MPGGQQPPFLGATLSRGYDPMSEADWPSVRGRGDAAEVVGIRRPIGKASSERLSPPCLTSYIYDV